VSKLWLLANAAVLLVCMPIVAFFALMGEVLSRLSYGCWYIAANIVPSEYRERLRKKLED
jgi:hypothetical protein